MAKKINALLRKNGITHRAIARDLGVTRTWVTLVLNHPRRYKSARIWKEIAKRVHKPVWEICPWIPLDRTHENSESGPRRKAA